MKIVRPTEVTVTFENAQEAARYLYAYYNVEAYYERLHFPIIRDAKITDGTTRVAAAVAAIEALAVDLAKPASLVPDKEHAAPTYISGSSDRVYLISEMPTRYIRNVLAMPATRQTKGLVDSLRGELRSRGESSYKAYDR